MDRRELQDDIVATLLAARAAERDVIGSLPEEVRLAPGPDGGWSPKDIQAHLSLWKARQAARHAAARRGEEIEPPDEDLDATNAELYASRADWSWDAIAAEAEEVTERLIAEVRATDLATLTGKERVLGGTMGNGAPHTLEHLPALARAHGTEERVLALAHEVEGIIRVSEFPDSDRASSSTTRPASTRWADGSMRRGRCCPKRSGRDLTSPSGSCRTPISKLCVASLRSSRGLSRRRRFRGASAWEEAAQATVGSRGRPAAPSQPRWIGRG